MSSMCFRRTAATTLGLLLLLPALSACGDDASAVEVGDLVVAREDSQFTDGTPSSLVLPIGRLEIFLGEPSEKLAATETRQLEAVAAPAGSTFVPITWQYDAATFGDHAAYVGRATTPKVELVSDEAGYQLPPPEATGEGGESFYVLVSGSAKELELSVTYDGVEQSVDLATGERKADDGAPIDELPPVSTKTRNCERGADFHGTKGFPDYSCRATRPIRLPYAAGAWAEPGRTFLALTVTTSVKRFDITGILPGSGAVYLPASVRSTFELDDAKPVAVLEDTSDTCPDLTKGGCTGRYAVVFDVPDDKSRFAMSLDQTFALVLGSRWGGFEQADEMDLDVSIDLALK